MAAVLSLLPEEMRRLGYAVVDRLVEHFETLEQRPPLRVGDAAESRAAVGGPPPEEPGDPDEALAILFEQVLPFGMRPDHPRLFARIPGPSNFVSVLADTAASGVNAFAGSWTSGSGPSAVELVVLDWLREICGMPDGTEGVLVSGGSVGTLVALAAARTARFGDRAPDDAVAYVSSEGHASIPRALRVLGFAPHQIRTVTAGPEHRLRADDVRAAMEEDGGAPFCLVATAGTTSTGAVDPLHELADLCAELGAWLHVDGAYGAPAVLCGAVDGLERADSLVLDPHKWLFQPYEAGCVLVREPGLLERAFAMSGVYLRDTLGGEIDFRDRSVQLTRAARALKLWLDRVFGLAAFREAVARGSRPPSTPRRCCGPAPAGRSSRRRSWPSCASGATATTRTRPGSRPRWCSTASPRPARPSSADASPCGSARSIPRTTFEDVERTVERMEAVSGSCA